jgi:sec-independent protein translocase protein TatA
VEEMVGVSFGGPEILIVLGIIVLLFGAKKLPELARSVGRSTSEFKKGIAEGDSSEEAGTSDDTEKRSERKAETTE